MNRYESSLAGALEPDLTTLMVSHPAEPADTRSALPTNPFAPVIPKRIIELPHTHAGTFGTSQELLDRINQPTPKLILAVERIHGPLCPLSHGLQIALRKIQGGPHSVNGPGDVSVPLAAIQCHAPRSEQRCGLATAPHTGLVGPQPSLRRPCTGG